MYIFTLLSTKILLVLKFLDNCPVIFNPSSGSLRLSAENLEIVFPMVGLSDVQPQQFCA